jgi:hypothetical protein
MLLQAEQLPQSSFDQQLMPQLAQVSGFVRCLNTYLSEGDESAVKDLRPPPGLIAALHDHLGALRDRVSFSGPDGSVVLKPPLARNGGAATTSSTTPDSHSMPLADFCSLLWRFGHVMTAILGLCTARAQPEGGGGAAVLDAIEQMLSIPGPAQALVQLGLSEPVQEAARQGASEASQCVQCLCIMFRTITYNLKVQVPSSGQAHHSSQQLEEAERLLEAFLNLEEHLPFLEALCLMPQLGPPPLCSSVA